MFEMKGTPQSSEGASMSNPDILSPVASIQIKREADVSINPGTPDVEKRAFIEKYSRAQFKPESFTGWVDEGLKRRAADLMQMVYTIQRVGVAQSNPEFDRKIAEAYDYLKGLPYTIINNEFTTEPEEQTDEWVMQQQKRQEEVSYFQNMLDFIDESIHPDTKRDSQLPLNESITKAQEVPNLEKWKTQPPDSVARLQSALQFIDNLDQSLSDLNFYFDPVDILMQLTILRGRVVQSKEIYYQQGIANRVDPDTVQKEREFFETAINESETPDHGLKVFNAWRKLITSRPPAVLVLLDQETTKVYGNPLSTGDAALAINSIEKLKQDVLNEPSLAPLFAVSFIAEFPDFANYIETTFLKKVADVKRSIVDKWVEWERLPGNSGESIQNNIRIYGAKLTEHNRIGGTKLSQRDLDNITSLISSYRSSIPNATQDQLAKWDELLHPLVDLAQDMQAVFDAEIVRVNNLRTEISKLRGELVKLQGRSLQISTQVPRIIDEAYLPLIQQVEKITPGSERDALLREVLQSEFKDYWFNYDSIMDEVEGKNLPGGAEFKTIETYVLSDLRKISESLNGQYDRLLIDLTRSFAVRKANHFAWTKMGPLVLTDESRKFPEKVSVDSELFITGADALELIRGNTYEYEYGKIVNKVLGKRKYRRIPLDKDFIPDPTQPGKMITRPGIVVGSEGGVDYVEKEFQETAMGFCMRFYDALYRGDVILLGSKGEPITISTIHSNLDTIINEAYRRVNNVANTTSKNEIPRLVAVRALRFSSFGTFHQSDLVNPNSASTGTSDPWLYTSHWSEYASGYIEKMKSGFSAIVTKFFFGTREVNPLSSHALGLSEKVMRDINTVVDNDDARTSPELKERRRAELGFASFGFMRNLPLFAPRNVSTGYTVAADGTQTYRTEARSFETILSTMSAKRMICDKDGNLVRDNRGKPTYSLATFDDMRAVGRYTKDQNSYAAGLTSEIQNGELVLVDKVTHQPVLLQGDEFVYEEMEFDKYAENKFVFDFISSKIIAGQKPTYERVLSLPEEKLFAELADASEVNGFRKAFGYAITSIAKVGFKIDTALPFYKQIVAQQKAQGLVPDADLEQLIKTLDLYAKAVPNLMVDTLLLALCLRKTSKEAMEPEDLWDEQKVGKFLEKLYKNGAISVEEFVMIYAATMQGRRFELFTSQVSEEFNKQMQDILKFEL